MQTKFLLSLPDGLVIAECAGTNGILHFVITPYPQAVCPICQTATVAQHSSNQLMGENYTDGRS